MKSCAAVIALLLFTRASSAQTPIRIADPDGSNPADGTLPSVVATDEGFALGWWDRRSIGQPGSRYGDPRFERFDAFGRRIGPETRLVLGPEFLTPPDVGEMERVQSALPDRHRLERIDRRGRVLGVVRRGTMARRVVR